GRRAKALARKRPQLQPAHPLEAQTAPAGGVAAVRRVVVVAHVGLDAERVEEAARVAGDERIVVPLGRIGEGVAAGALAQVLVGEDDLVVGTEGERVLPGRLLALGLEARRRRAAALRIVEARGE